MRGRLHLHLEEDLPSVRRFCAQEFLGAWNLDKKLEKSENLDPSGPFYELLGPGATSHWGLIIWHTAQNFDSESQAILKKGRLRQPPD